MRVLEKILDTDTRFVWQMIFHRWNLGVDERDSKKDQNVKIHRNAGS